MGESRLLRILLEKKLQVPDKHFSFPGMTVGIDLILYILGHNEHSFDVFSVLNEHLSIADRKVTCFSYQMKNNSHREVHTVKNHLLE